MELPGLAEWKSSTAYTPEQVKAVIESLGIEIAVETDAVFKCYCPFHSNTYTAAFAVNKATGLYLCYNPDCEANYGGEFEWLVMQLSDRNRLEAKRFIAKKGSETKKDITSILSHLTEAEERMPIIPQMKIDELVEQFWSAPDAVEYMRGRGFTDETIKTFEVGFDRSRQLVTVPIHSPDGDVVGVNGRGIYSKRHKLSKRLPRNRILFNLHRAKQSPIAVITESQFDSMRVHQAGYPNTVATMGSHVSKEQFALLQKYFERVIIMMDADKAGRKAGRNIASGYAGKVEWAIWSEDEVYPHGAKDPGEMTDEEIKKCIENSVSNLEYTTIAVGHGA